MVPILTSASAPRGTGTPALRATTMLRRSSSVVTLPSLRTSSTSSPSPSRPAPSLRLLAWIVSFS
jgi:hypothetical protein